MRHFMHSVLVMVLLVGLISACGQLEEPLELRRTSDPAMKPLTEASPPLGPTETVDLIAAQTEDIGSVTCWINGDYLFIEYATDGGWSLAETHCAVAEVLEDIPATPSENPKVGRFPLKKEHEPFTSVHTDSLDMVAWGFDEAEELIIAAHADVEVLSGEGAVLREEGAWGAGESFSETMPEDPHQIERPEDPSKGPFTKVSDHPGRGNWSMYFTVSVKKLKGLILWNRLGSEHEVTHSRVGPDGSIEGTVIFDACKFDNGVKSLGLNDYVFFNDVDGVFPNPNRWTIEFWVKTEFDVVNGAASDNKKHMMLANIDQQPPSPGIYKGINFYFDTERPEHPLRFDLYDGEEPFTVAVTDEISDWSAGDLVHLAIVADNTACFDGNKTAAIYVNGIQTAYSTSSFSVSSFLEPLVLGVYLFQSREYLGNCYIDNIKIWNYPKTDFSDRFKE